MTNCISSVIGYVTPVSSRRDENNRPELEGYYQPLSSTAVEWQDDYVIGEQ